MKARVVSDLVVLVLDDDPLTDGLAARLSDSGFQVFVATDRASALRLDARHRPQIILFDVRFSRGSGLDVWRVVRNRRPSTRAVLYSGTATATEGFQAHELGVDAVLPKPAPIAEVAQALRRALFGIATMDPVDELYADLDRSAEKVIGSALPARVVGLLGDVRIDLLSFDRLAAICKSQSSSGSWDPSLTRRRLCELLEFRAQVGPHARDLLGLIASSVESADGDWPLDVRAELHSSTGRWPHSWYRLARLRSAAHELLRTREQVAQIAVQLGFSCGGRLCHDLHELVGLSPTELRRLHSGESIK